MSIYSYTRNSIFSSKLTTVVMENNPFSSMICLQYRK